MAPQAAVTPTPMIETPAVFEVDDVVRWVRPGLWRVVAVEAGDLHRLVPADETAGRLAGPVPLRTQGRYLRAGEPTATAA